MDYYKIGQRIRKIRKAKGYSQENLAEMVDVSVTHISHIETGNTKMSFELVEKIADNLNVSLDYLAHDVEKEDNAYSKQIADMIVTCSDAQKRVIFDTIKAMVNSFEVNNLNAQR